MKLPDIDATYAFEPAKIALDDIIGDLFHDAQNGVHLVGMELELVSMGVGNSSDAVKTAGIVRQLENNLRDLRGYISALQDPSATCDPAAVLDGIVMTLQSRNRDEKLKLTAVIPESMPSVRAHPKLVARILERVFEFCEDLLQPGAEFAIEAARRHIGRQVYVEISLTMFSAAVIPMAADEVLCGSAAAKGRSYKGIERALEVLRRLHGNTVFRRHSDFQCQFSLHLLSLPE
jgi:hypothetical protein